MKKNRSDAERFIHALEADGNTVDRMSPVDRETLRLGAAIREVAEQDLPAPNASLREKLIDSLESDSLSSPGAKSKPSKPGMDNGKVWRVALAASLLLALGLVALSLQISSTENADENVAQLDYSDTDADTTVPARVFGDFDQKVVDQSDETDKSKRLHDDDIKYNPIAKSEATADSMLFYNGEVATVGPAVDPKYAPDAGVKVDEFANATNFGEGAPESTEAVTGLLKKTFGDKVNLVEGKPNPTPRYDSNQLASLSERSVTPAAPSTIVVPPRLAENFGQQNQSATRLGSAQVFNGEAASGGRGGGGFGGSAVGGVVVGGGRGAGGDGENGYGYYRTEGKTRAFFEYMDYKGKGYIRPEHELYFKYGRSGRGFGNQPNNEQYDSIIENEFAKAAGTNALSTFSIDVDTASYANMRRFLLNGQCPPRNSVRIEELINYFNYDYAQPKNDRPFAVNMEIANCPWNEQHHLLRVALKGKEIHRSERSPSNLVFLLDVSGSMQDPNKLPLLKQGLTMMVQQLTENDSVSIVTYAGSAGVALNPTNGSNKRQIEQAIERLHAGGSTNGSAGIEMAYDLAQKQFLREGSNRVILATDGDLNVGVTDDNALVKLITRKASEGVFLTVLGFGTGNLKDSKLEKLADNGNGMYAYIDNFREAHKVLIEQMSGSLETIAKDVKIQIEFNPAEVKAYRLIGYENRVLAAQDFDDDRKDAGEIGAGHSVTALYELVLAGSSPTAGTLQHLLKYQQPDQPEAKPAADNKNETSHSGELLTLKLRYKQPAAQQSEKIEFVLKDEPTSFSSASDEFRFAAAVASFGMILRQSKYCGNTSLKWVEDTASRAIGDDIGGYRSEFLDLVRRASAAH